MSAFSFKRAWGGGGGSGGGSSAKSEASTPDGGSSTTKDDLESPPPDTTHQRILLPRDYCDAYQNYPVESRDLDSRLIKWSNMNHFELGDLLGSGFFGQVYAAVDLRTNAEVCVKTLKTEKKEKDKLRREIMMLEEVRGGPNIVTLVCPVRDSTTLRKSLVFERIDYENYRELYPQLTDIDCRFYAYKLLQAINHTHSVGVFHRDIKPSNVLIDPYKQELRLIDWGVAGFYVPSVRNQRGPGTRCYKAPELCLRYDYYDYAVDMWAYGATLGSLILLEHPLIRGKGSWFNQLLAIVDVVGSADLFDYMNKLGITLSPAQMKRLSNFPKKEWTSYINSANAARATPDALDLISKLVVCDHTQRLTAREALLHPYFNSVRDEGFRPPPMEREYTYDSETYSDYDTETYSS